MISWVHTERPVSQRHYSIHVQLVLTEHLSCAAALQTCSLCVDLAIIRKVKSLTCDHLNLSIFFFATKLMSGSRRSAGLSYWFTRVSEHSKSHPLLFFKAIKKEVMSAWRAYSYSSCCKVRWNGYNRQHLVKPAHSTRRLGESGPNIICIGTYRTCLQVWHFLFLPLTFWYIRIVNIFVCLMLYNDCGNFRT